MDHFHLRNGELYAEDVPLARIAEEVGTPVYVYSRATLERHARVFREGLAGAGPVHFAFAVKANPNLAVLRVMQREGFGADVVSGGELARALAAGMAAEDIVFSGVGKQHYELVRALAACGRQRDLMPVAGQPAPPVPYGRNDPPTSAELLVLDPQAAPERSVELRRQSEEREDDPFDLPPEG